MKPVAPVTATNTHNAHCTTHFTRVYDPWGIVRFRPILHNN